VIPLVTASEKGKAQALNPNSWLDSGQKVVASKTPLHYRIFLQSHWELWPFLMRPLANTVKGTKFTWKGDFL